MRQAEIRRNYEQLHDDQDSFPLQTVSIGGHAHIGSVIAQMAPGVTVFCGVSGVGKSQFLEVLAAHIQGHGTGDVSVVATGNDVRGRGRPPSGCDTTIEHDQTTVRCLHVDTAYECYDTISQVRPMPLSLV